MENSVIPAIPEVGCTVQVPTIGFDKVVMDILLSNNSFGSKNHKCVKFCLKLRTKSYVLYGFMWKLQKKY